MGGSSGKKKKAPKVETIDYGAMMRQANESAAAAARAQVQAQLDAYPQLEALQLGTIRKISDNLNNQYTAEARAALGRATADTGEIRSIGSILQQQAPETAIERTLRQQAEAELALGRGLSPEEVRDSQQAARAAFAARGLGTSMGSTAAEILNRDSAARAREADRRTFAGNVNNMVTGNVTNRFGQAANVLGNAAQLEGGIASQTANLDPYSRALGSAQIGSQLSGNLTNSLGQTWQGAQNLAGDAFSFNANARNWQNFNRYAMNNMGGGGNNMLMGGLGGAASGAASGFMIGGPYGAAIGGGLGLGMGLLGSR